MRAFLLVFFITALSTQSFTQVCTGNLGVNIFTEGDFGSGTANILTPNPQIAPGYIYQTNPPPNDGYYSITNSTSNWGSFAGDFWINIKDNSNDPFGYMMVVNASYEPGLFYEQEIDGLCENTLFEFSADMINLLMGMNGIKPNVSFLLDGEIVYQTGDIPQDAAWHTYGFTFTTEPGQTSLTLALQNNAPGGNGNDLALDNITFRACGPEALILPDEIANICEDGDPIELEATINGDQYPTPFLQWQQSFDEGLTWVDLPGETNLTYTHTGLSGGFYYYRYLLANGPSNILNSKCRVVSNVKIVNVVPKFYTIVDTLCTGLSFELKDNLYSETGIYVDSLFTVLGCDSIVTLDLTIVPDPEIDVVFDVAFPSCDYLEDGNITINSILNGVPPYSILIDEELSIDGSLSNLGEGDFTYSIVDQYGCAIDTTLSLINPQPFTIDLGDDLQVDLGEPLPINAFFSEPVGNFQWEPAELINCEPDCEDLELTPISSTLISLTAFSADGGCIATDSIFVEVNPVREVHIPNIFSPNDDGINDFFAIYGKMPNVQSIEEWVVFDRWGSTLYEAENILPNEPSIGWDGTSGGRELPNGVYTYMAKIRFLDGALLVYSGDVALLR